MSPRFIPRPLLCALFICAASAAPSFSQVAIVKVGWEISKLTGKTRSPFAPVTELRAAPELKFADHLRAIVTLRNSTAKPVEGLVLR